jgi:hypothetical protein
MTTVATFDSPEEAHLFRAFLGAHDIGAAVLDEHLAQWIWYYIQAIGGVRVVVAGPDAPRAANLYREYTESLRRGPHPVEPVRWWLPVLLLSILIDGPLPIFGRRRVKARDADERPAS